MKRLAIALALVVLPAAAAADEPATVSAEATLGEIDIHEFIQSVARVTDLTFIVDPRVGGTVSATRPAPAARDELLDFFIDTLRASGVSAVPSVGGAYRIFPAQDSVRRTSASLGGPIGAARL